MAEFLKNEHNPFTGVTTKYTYDPVEDRLNVHQVQETTPAVEFAKKKYNAAPETGRWKNDLNHVAEIPTHFIEAYKRRTGIDLMRDKEAMKKFLNDPEFRYFRTMPGKV